MWTRRGKPSLIDQRPADGQHPREATTQGDTAICKKTKTMRLSLHLLLLLAVTVAEEPGGRREESVAERKIHRILMDSVSVQQLFDYKGGAHSQQVDNLHLEGAERGLQYNGQNGQARPNIHRSDQRLHMNNPGSLMKAKNSVVQSMMMASGAYASIRYYSGLGMGMGNMGGHAATRHDASSKSKRGGNGVGWMKWMMGVSMLQLPKRIRQSKSTKC
jgi:hypothetical protein